jgi:putative endonuclease
MAAVYVLYSKKIDAYYIGSCHDLDGRLLEHTQKRYKSSFTVRADDWELFLKIEDLNFQQARNIEAHVKRMKSREYLQNLILYPEIINKLIQRY